MPKISPSDAGNDAERGDERDERADAEGELEEARALGRVGRGFARRSASAPTRASGSLTLGTVMLIGAGPCGSDVLGRDGGEARGDLRLRDKQRLGADAEHAVAALELRAVDGEVGLVDQLVGAVSVHRVAGDADRDRRADRLARRLDLEARGGDGGADPLGDLQRLLRRRLRQEDRELLAAEAGGDVVVAKLLRGTRPRSP